VGKGLVVVVVVVSIVKVYNSGFSNLCNAQYSDFIYQKILHIIVAEKELDYINLFYIKLP
jgi:hypothetical protein